MKKTHSSSPKKNVEKEEKCEKTHSFFQSFLQSDSNQDCVKLAYV